MDIKNRRHLRYLLNSAVNDAQGETHAMCTSDDWTAIADTLKQAILIIEDEASKLWEAEYRTRRAQRKG